MTGQQQTLESVVHAQPGRVSTVHLAPGTRVATTEPCGTDFGLPLVSPANRRRGAVVRTVRSHLRAHGGHVVWFTDGTKTPALHGRTAWVVLP